MENCHSHLSQEDIEIFINYQNIAQPFETIKPQCDVLETGMNPENFYDIDYKQENDDREILDKNSTKLFVGQLYSRFGNDADSDKTIIRGSAFLIQIEELSHVKKANDDGIPFKERLQHFQQLSDEQQLRFEIENNYYCILTCAHNLQQESSKGKSIIAEDLRIFLGKPACENNEKNLNSESLPLVLDPKDILIPVDQKDFKPDSGYDIALIGLSRKNKEVLINFFKQKFASSPQEFRKLKKSICLQNNKIFSNLESQNAEKYIQDQYLLQFHFKKYSIFDRIIYQNYDANSVYQYSNFEEFYIGVCGYPADQWHKKLSPQIEQFKKFTIDQLIYKLKQAKQEKILQYREIKTSSGQSGSPIILQHKDGFQIIGVHTAGGNAIRKYNLGTFFEGFLGLRYLFRDYSVASRPDIKFDAFLKAQKQNQLGLDF